MRGAWRAGAVLALVVALAAASTSGSAERRHRPNIVVVLADDLDRAGLRYMDKTRALIAGHGVRFTNAYATSPLCCPSRASIMTGRYVHNHGVKQSDGPHGGHQEFLENVDASETLGVKMSNAGYATAYLGKYMNQFARGVDETWVPPGWSNWFGLVDRVYEAYKFVVSDNGNLRRFGEGADGYQTDVLADEAASYIDRRIDSGPFLMIVAPTPPHQEPPGVAPDGHDPRAAPRHEGDLAGEPLPKPPSFNERSVRDKPVVIRNEPPLNGEDLRSLKALHRNRAETLLAIDELVARLVQKLRDGGELEDTVVIVTSDNGFLHGEHRLIGKREPYEESAGVPLLIRGPGFPAGEKRDQLAANIDLMPTMLDLAGAGGEKLDGVSLLPLAGKSRAGIKRDIVLEMFNRDGALRYQGVRSRKWVYLEWFSGDQELYDLERDRYQLRSVDGRRKFRPVERRLAARLDELRHCRGRGCH